MSCADFPLAESTGVASEPRGVGVESPEVIHPHRWTAEAVSAQGIVINGRRYPRSTPVPSGLWGPWDLPFPLRPPLPLWAGRALGSVKGIASDL
jgi:hypothetical protein